MDNMYNTPRKSHENRTYSTPKKLALKGLFQNGVWHCNCKQRLPAAHFLVRKEGPNKGRWFYTCQEPKESGCGFFLWDDDAVGREMMAVVNNSRSESAATLEGPVSDRKSADRRTVEGHIEASNKWMAGLVKKEEEDFGEWPLSANEENFDVGSAEDTSLHQTEIQYPQTPKKAAKVDMFSTPGSKRQRDQIEAWPTPNTGRKQLEDVFATPSTIRVKVNTWDENERLGLISPSVTPTPARFHDGNQHPEAAESISDQKDDDITKEVMDILKDQSLDEDVNVKVRQVLNKHALKTKGIARGRDITRITLKTKDSKIAELEQRIVELQNERELDKVIIKHFKSDMAQSLNKRS